MFIMQHIQSDSHIIHNNTGDLHFGVCGNTCNNGNNPNQSATDGNGNGVTNQVKSSGDIAVMDTQLIQSNKVYVEYNWWLMLY